MHTLQIIPDKVTLWIWHPWGGDKDEEDNIHDYQHYYKSKNLYQNMKYNRDRNTVFFTDEQEVCKEQKYEIIVGSYETTPCRYMLIIR